MIPPTTTDYNQILDQIFYLVGHDRIELSDLRKLFYYGMLEDLLPMLNQPEIEKEIKLLIEHDRPETEALQAINQLQERQDFASTYHTAFKKCLEEYLKQVIPNVTDTAKQQQIYKIFKSL